ncbi:reverse transcriptase domain-containing protein [Methylobacterium sp. NMS14P]|uniref:reverse transcriptase domain-containing protein n=1 Tax=Methylobacterium sp. NMS14P TaxID=2894310 RepID=UPI003FD52C51
MNQLLLDLDGDLEKTIIAYKTRIASKKALPVFDIEHLSYLVGYDQQLIYDICNAQYKFYRSYTIKKKLGGVREIDEPLPTLKEIQRWLLDNIFSAYPVSRAARAYKKGNSVRGNASVHTRQPQVLRVDVRNFFGSILFTQVRDILYSIGYTQELSVVIANLCCLNGRLPQGAPTSPALSNIFMVDFDATMLSYAKANGLRYTRYADDIVISGKVRFEENLRFIKKELTKKTLRVNPDKTVLNRNGSRKMVTGLVVNDQVSVERSYRREFRQASYYIRRWGLDGHMKFRHIQKRNYLLHLIGVGNHIVSIHPGDDRARSDLHYLMQLSKQYV